MKKHGMPTRHPVFTEAALNNRQNPNVHHAFATVLGTPKLLVSHDRYGFLRPTKNVNIDGRLVNTLTFALLFRRFALLCFALLCFAFCLLDGLSPK
jgi:hypothetical protein